MGLAVEVDAHFGYPRGLAGEEHVVGVGAAAGPQPDQTALADRHAGHDDRVDRRLGGRLGRPPVVAGQRLGAGGRVTEHAVEPLIGSGRTDGLPFFTSILKKLVNA